MKQTDIDKAVEAFRWACPYSSPLIHLDRTKSAYNCWEYGSEKHNYKCGSHICKRLRKFINILKEPEQ